MLKFRLIAFAILQFLYGHANKAFGVVVVVGNKEKIERKVISSCLIPCLLIAYLATCDILAGLFLFDNLGHLCVRTVSE